MNYCFEMGQEYQTIANYSHLIPVFMALFLGVYTLYKTNYSKLSITFFLFTFTFSLWLVGDVFTWIFYNDYFSVFSWSWLDYINTVFFALGAYFFSVLARGRISLLEKILIVLVGSPIFLITVTGDSISGFYQPVCEALNNRTITLYKLFSESFYIVFIIVSFFIAHRKSDKNKKFQLVVIMSAILLFFAVFSLTEYMASVTGIYEINLYGLFVLPVFLIIMVFSITHLGVFKIRFLGTQLLVYTLIIMTASQFLFLQNSTDAALNAITLVVSVLFGLVLLRNAKKELEARTQIEVLAHDLGTANNRLLELDKQKTEFVSFASHQLRSPLTALKGYISLILEGDYGPITDDLKKAAQIIFDSTKTMASVVDNYLNVSRIELGQMKYEFAIINLKDLILSVFDELKISAEKAGLKLEFNFNKDGNYKVLADKEKLKEVISNLLDNSIKYTPNGKININLEEKNKIVRLSIKDTGIGISKDVIPKLFARFSRASNANKTNMRGTGLGLFLAKEIVNAHKGKIWVESEGEGNGSCFYVELESSK